MTVRQQGGVLFLVGVLIGDIVTSQANAQPCHGLSITPRGNHVELEWQTQSVVPLTPDSVPIYPDYIIYRTDSFQSWRRVARFDSSQIGGSSQSYALGLPDMDQGFFRAEVQVSLPGRDLASLNLVNADLRGANDHGPVNSM